MVVVGAGRGEEGGERREEWGARASNTRFAFPFPFRREEEGKGGRREEQRRW